MPLKRKITKDEHTKLAKELQGEYKAQGDEFVLDLDGEDDPDELRRARDREREGAKTLRKQLKTAQDAVAEAEEKLAALDGNDDRKKGDIEKIDNSWKAKMDKANKEAAETLAKNQLFIRKTLIDSTATKIAAEISTSPSLMARAVSDRLSVTFDGDEPTLVILGSDGKPAPTLTLDTLKKEFLTNKEYASIIIASKASGGGAPQRGSDQKPGSTGASEKPADLSKLTGSALAEHIKSMKAAT